MNQTNETLARRYKAYVSTLGTTQLHLRNPFVIAWWSAAFPGLGHLLLSKYLRGFLLFIWEVIVNYKANINLALLYSFTGRFEMAKDVLDIEWMLLYLPAYLFAIWDSYRTTIDINRNYMLAAREDAQILRENMNAMEINYLDKRKPWVAAIWSSLVIGAGQLYIHRIITAAFLVIWSITVIYLSKLLPGIHFTLLGDFQQAREVIDPHWFLNIPSIYFFAMYDAYVNTVENNKLFDWEQSKFLKRQYQSKNFVLPFQSERIEGEAMYVVSTFEYSGYLELAITAVEMKGVEKENILAIPMDKKGEDRKLFDSIHQSDGLSLFDLPAILATIFSIFGSIYGFVLAWGPIIWGLIGIASGFLIGLIIKLIITKKYSDRQNKTKAPEVVLFIRCQADQIEMVKNTLWEHHALGVSRLDLSGESA